MLTGLGVLGTRNFSFTFLFPLIPRFMGGSALVSVVLSRWFTVLLKEALERGPRDGLYMRNP